MMNSLALCLVLISLVTAPTPSPVAKHEQQHNHPTVEEDVIVKEGHRVVVVEFEKEDGNTKVSISPQEAQSHLPHPHKPPPPPPSWPINGHGQSPKEFVCDALGKCMHKVASALSKAKETVHEVEEHAAETVSEALRKAKEAVSNKTGRISDKALEVEEAAKEGIREAKEKVSEKAHRVEKGAKDAVRHASQKAKETVSDKVEGAKQTVSGKVEGAKEMAAKAKQDAQAVLESAKEQAKEKARQGDEMAEQAAETVKLGAERLKEEGSKMAEQAKETVKTGVKKVKEEGEKELNETLRRGREVGHDVVLPYLESVMGVVHLLGFATAYGMCMWVTFVSSYVLAGALPRQQFGVVQSKIYPVYFRTMAYCVLVALFGRLLGKRKRLLLFNVAEMVLVYHLLASLFLILFNLLYFEPRATKVMFERMKLEKEEGRGRDILISDPSSRSAAEPVVEPPATPAPAAGTASTPPVMQERSEQEVKSRIIVLSKRLKKLNAYSSFLNILTLMVLTWHLVYLGQLLHAAC